MTNDTSNNSDETTLEHAKLALRTVREKLQNATPDAIRKNIASVHVEWDGDQRFVTGRPGGEKAVLDGTAKAGQSPVDALLSALAACVSIDAVEILKKQRATVSTFTVDVTGRRFEGVPRRVVQIRLDFSISGDAIDREKAERAIELSMTKYCSVHDSLAADIPIEWTLTLNGEKGRTRIDSTRPEPKSD